MYGFNCELHRGGGKPEEKVAGKGGRGNRRSRVESTEGEERVMECKRMQVGSFIVSFSFYIYLIKTRPTLPFDGDPLISFPFLFFSIFSLTPQL